MSSANLAYINPAIIAWARKRAGVSISYLSGRLKIPEQSISDWEARKGLPTFSAAERMAAELHIPFGYLFLSEAPDHEVPIPDLRTVGGGPPPPLSVDFIDILQACLIRQEWYSDYLASSGARRLPFPGSMKTADGSQAVADNISAALGIHDGLREESDNWEQFRIKLIDAAERIGVLVMQSGVGANNLRPLSVAEFRGFAVTDQFAPLVFINTKDAPTARIFTLIHELAHIWIGESGISNPEPRKKSTEQSNAIERFCNKVAAEVLVPRLGISKRWNKGKGVAENVQATARYYRVSRYVAVRQAYESDLITKAQYLSYLDANPSLWRVTDSNRSSGGSFYPTFFARNSRRVIRGVVKALGESRITYREASGLFGVTVKTVKTVAERFGE